MSEDRALEWLAVGALFIAIGAVAQALLATMEAGRGKPLSSYWPTALAWAAIMSGSICTVVGAGHLANWW